MTRIGSRLFGLAVAFAFAAPLFAVSAQGAVVICQKKNKIKLRMDVCKNKETLVAATELGVVGPAGPAGMDGAAGPAGPPGPEGPSSLVGAAHVASDGSLLSSHAPGLIVTSAPSFGDGTYDVTFTGTGMFTGAVANDFILNVTSRTNNWNVANAQVISVTDDALTVGVFNWESDTGGGPGDFDVNCYLTVYRGAAPPAP